MKKINKIVLHDYGGYPFLFDLSTELSKNGYEVIHVFSSASGSPNGDFRESENLKIIDLGEELPKVDKSSFIKRFLQENTYGDLIVKTIEELKPDLVLSSNTPLLAQRKIIRICNKKNILVVHWLQDILSIAAKSVLDKRNVLLGNFVGSFFKRIEYKCLKKSNYVLSISNDFNDVIIKWGIPIEKIRNLDNWAQIDKITQHEKINKFSTKNKVSDTINIVYTGTLGLKQNPEVLGSIAQHFKLKNERVRIVVISTGEGSKIVKNIKDEAHLDNLLLLPLQPYEDLPYVLSSADLLIGTLNPAAGDYCVPSKILTYYCSGVPCFLITPKTNKASVITEKHDLGYVVDPSNYNSIIEGLESAIDNCEDRKLKGLASRQYAENNFKPKNVYEKFINQFPELEL